MKSACLLVHCLTILLVVHKSTGTINIITDLIQQNVVGIPLLHQVQQTPFDPDAGLRHAIQYEKENGFRGEKLIERLGLGTDGNQEQRLRQQQKRDEGHLGGLNFYRP